MLDNRKLEKEKLDKEKHQTILLSAWHGLTQGNIMPANN